jgi:F420-non-reducing hydrogenase iron-sulfur subunit
LKRPLNESPVRKKDMVKETRSAERFEPKIIAFLCNWCSYAGADLAGVSRFQYPSNTRTIRVMCTGTISPHHILKAFQKGADGVLLLGCHIGDCHYLKGNYMTLKRVAVLKELLKFTGFQEERLYLDWVSAAEGVKFAEVVRSFTQKIKELGPSHLRTSY